MSVKRVAVVLVVLLAAMAVWFYGWLFREQPSITLHWSSGDVAKYYVNVIDSDRRKHRIDITTNGGTHTIFQEEVIGFVARPHLIPLHSNLYFFYCTASADPRAFEFRLNDYQNVTHGRTMLVVEDWLNSNYRLPTTGVLRQETNGKRPSERFCRDYDGPLHFYYGEEIGPTKHYNVPKS